MSNLRDPDATRAADPTLEDVALALAAVRRSRFETGDQVAVLGLNTAGIAAVRLLRQLGAGRIDCIDDDGELRDAAVALGGSASTAVAYAQWAAEHPADLPRRLLMFARSSGLLELAANAAGRRGVIVVVAGAAPEHATIPDYYLNMIMKETAIIGVNAPTPAEQQEAEVLLRSGWKS